MQFVLCPVYCLPLSSAIVVKEDGELYAIGFSRKGKEIRKEAARIGEESAQIGEQVRSGILKVVSGVISKVYETEIQKEELSNFADKKMKYRVYQYGEPKGEEFPDGGTTDKDRNGECAAEIAKVFLNCAGGPQAFGAYNFGNWNCEVFATFCKTTTLSVENLRDKMSEMNHKGQSSLKNFLQGKTVSKATSIQGKRFKKQGVLFHSMSKMEDGDVDHEEAMAHQVAGIAAGAENGAGDDKDHHDTTCSPCGNVDLEIEDIDCFDEDIDKLEY